MTSETCCCGCVSLRAGAVAIGVILTTASSLSVAGFLGGLLYLLLERPVSTPVPVDITGALLALSALHLVFSALLLHGARRGRRDLLLAWLIFTAIVVILQTMAVVVAVALAGMTRSEDVLDSALPAAGAVWTGLLAYCFTVVLYRSLELNKQAAKKLGSGAAAKDGGTPANRVQVV